MSCRLLSKKIPDLEILDHKVREFQVREILVYKVRSP